MVSTMPAKAGWAVTSGTRSPSAETVRPSRSELGYCWPLRMRASCPRGAGRWAAGRLRNDARCARGVVRREIDGRIASAAKLLAPRHGDGSIDAGFGADALVRPQDVIV